MKTALVPTGKLVKGIPLALDGAKIVAYAMKQMNPDVVPVYPITPQTEIVSAFSEYVANGEVDSEMINVESEHAAMSACIGASAAGARAQTATTSAGMAFMWEVLYVASGSRLPIVMHFVNRALSAPLNIHCDHSDSMGARDSGWIQLFGENVQEAYDNALQAIRIAEHPDVLLPIMHTQDGFVISHGIERAEVLPDEAVREFIGTYKPQYSLLDPKQPVTYGPVNLQDYYFEHKRQQVDGMEKALGVIPQVAEEYERLSGRHYGLLDPYRMDDAEFVIVIMGSAAGTARGVVAELRGKGIKAGLLKIRCYRPFPAKAVADALRGKKAVAVMDRAISFGAQGNPVFLDVSTVLNTYRLDTRAVDFVYGLGGRDVMPRHIHQAFQEILQVAETGETTPVVRYLGLRE
ncbi:MAG: pyruvate ferredoxin oxidoreductase [Dehalococcoidia bacterium]|nr:pyruvate ferredoxin oxidoreductase [Dehalococcoidia bacterium]